MNGEISLINIFEILFKKKNIVLICIIISTLLGGTYSYTTVYDEKTSYEAISSVAIIYNYKTPSNPEDITEGYVYFQDRVNTSMIPTIAGYSQSINILRTIIEELDIKNKDGKLIKASKLKKNIVIENSPGSNLILFKVKYNNKDIAAKIANKIPEKLIEMSKTNIELKDYKVNIIDYAIPTEAEENSKILPLIIGAFLGLIIGIFFALALNFTNRKIQSPFAITNMDFDVEGIISNPIALNLKNRILLLSQLSNAKKILLGMDIRTSNELLIDLEESLNSFGIEAEVESYCDVDFLLRSREVDKIFIIVEENKSEFEIIKDISTLIRNYNINISLLYIKR